MTMAKVKNIDEGVDYKKAIEIFAQGVEAVKQRGKADVGEKTMMDVLIPVANCFKMGFKIIKISMKFYQKLFKLLKKECNQQKTY